MFSEDDAVACAEVNTKRIDNGEILFALAVSERPAHAVQKRSANWEEPLYSIKKLNEILVGYFHYYGITDNARSIKAFRYEVIKSLFYWLNRCSQKKSYNWNDFLKMIDECHPIAKARIYLSVYSQ